MKHTSPTKNYKSVKLEASVKRALKTHVQKYPNMDEAAKALGLSRGTLVTALSAKKTCASETLAKLLPLLNNGEVAHAQPIQNAQSAA